MLSNDERDRYIIETRNDMKWLKASHERHINTHFRYNILAWGAVITAILSMIISYLSV